LKPENGLKTEVNKSEQYRAWAGDEQDFRRIIETAHHEMQKLVPATEEAVRQSRRPYEDDTEFQRRFDDVQARVVPTVSATTRDGELTYTGSVDEILAEADHRQLSNVTAHTPRYAIGSEDPPGSVKIELRDQYLEPGVVVSVSGTDYAWVSGVISALHAAVKPGVPLWSWMRSFPAGLAAALVLGLLFELPLILFADDASVVWNLLAGVAGYAVVAFAVRYLPGFELRSVGATPSGTRRLKAAGVVLAFLVGVASLVVTVVGLTAN
jgi:hypothetical protein